MVMMDVYLLTLFKIPYTSKHLRGKTFVVGQQNGHSWETFMVKNLAQERLYNNI